MDTTELIALITEKVLAQISPEPTKECSPATGAEVCRKQALVLGGTCPAELKEERWDYTLQDRYNGAVTDYDRVIIVSLDFCQLADLAMGRNGDALTDIVLRALLSGVEVLMSEEALPHRAFRERGHSMLYRTMEGYVQTLCSYGVRIPREKAALTALPVRAAQYRAEKVAVPAGTAVPSEEKLITESRARAMLAAGKEIRLRPGTLVTPSALDVFRQAHVNIVREE